MADEDQASSTLDDVFEELEPESEVSDEAAADIVATPEQSDDESSSEKGEETEAKADDKSTEADEDEGESPSPEQPKSVPESALIGERRRRQEAEARLRELEKQTAPDPHEDPEGFASHHENQSLKSKLEISRELMADVHEDFAEKEAVFMELVKNGQGEITNAALVEQMTQAKNPAKFAYEYAKEHLEIEQYRDPAKREALKAQMLAESKEALKKEVREELLKEFKGSAEADDGKVPATGVPSLTRAAAVGSNTIPKESLESLEDMFADSEL